jgi:hypothetical protein
VGLGVGAGISVFELVDAVSSEAPVHVKSSVKVETFSSEVCTVQFMYIMCRDTLEIVKLMSYFTMYLQRMFYTEL